jgi:S-formylglutathione hydrolase FrmB
MMNTTLAGLVVVPDSGSTSADSLPVVYLLHGYGANPYAWGQHLDLASIADRYGCIIVCPDGSENSWYLDSPVDTSSRYETYISTEVVDWVDQHYPTLRAPRGRAITGISMGGHGSLYIAIRHQERFGAAGSISGVLDLLETTQEAVLAQKLGEYGIYPSRWREHSVVNHLEKLRGSDMALSIMCGADDPFALSNRRTHQELLSFVVAHDYTEFPGGHSWEVWGRACEYQFLFFRDFFNRRRL